MSTRENVRRCSGGYEICLQGTREFKNREKESWRYSKISKGQFADRNCSESRGGMQTEGRKKINLKKRKKLVRPGILCCRKQPKDDGANLVRLCLKRITERKVREPSERKSCVRQGLGSVWKKKRVRKKIQTQTGVASRGVGTGRKTC